MKEFIDKTSTQSGTPFNRANMMAIQGFVARTTEFSGDTIIETNPETGEKLTTKFNGNTITETFEGQKKIIKTTTFNSDGSISEVISQ